MFGVNNRAEGEATLVNYFGIDRLSPATVPLSDPIILAWICQEMTAGRAYKARCEALETELAGVKACLDSLYGRLLASEARSAVARVNELP